jgi:thymidylate synthase (FAD)
VHIIVIVPPYAEVVASPTYDEALDTIERAARTCHQSQQRASTSLQASETFIAKIIRMGHLSVLEHVVVTVRIVTDRGVTHELVRHRVGVAYSQESTRYVRYTDGLLVIEPWWWSGGDGAEDNLMLRRALFTEACVAAAKSYASLLAAGASPQQARAVLPTAVKTEIVVTANIREWRHILSLRCAPEAHPDMQRVMKIILQELYTRFPVFFEDLNGLLA